MKACPRACSSRSSPWRSVPSRPSPAWRLRNAARRSRGARPDRRLGRGDPAARGGACRDFTLHDQDGRTVTAASLRGKPVVFAFVYSTCRDTCPAQVQTIRGALDEIHRDLPVVGVSVDPANDTPKRAKAFLLKQR